MLVDFDPNSTFDGIPSATGAAMVELVWHSLVDDIVNLDGDIIAGVVGSEVCGGGGRRGGGGRGGRRRCRHQSRGGQGGRGGFGCLVIKEQNK